MLMPTMSTSRWKKVDNMSLGLWLASPIVLHKLLTIFHIILPQVVLRTVAHKSEKELNLSLAPML